MKIIQCLVFLFFLIGISNAKSLVLSKEQPIILHIDRSQYISGDALMFEVFLYHGLVARDAPGLDVFVDIIDEKNTWIDGAIVKQKDGIATGFLYLPDSLISANYQLRAYTQFPGNGNYCCIQKIQVTNRFGKSRSTYQQDNGPENTNRICLQSINTDKEVYSTRQKVSIDFNSNRLTEFYPIYASIRVINKKQWENQIDASIEHCFDDITVQSSNISIYNGTIVKGIVTDGFFEKPIPNVVVFISCMDSLVRLKYDITDENGNFSFLINDYYGNNPFYFNAFNIKDLTSVTNAVIKILPQFNQSNFANEPNTGNHTILPDSSEINKAIITKAYENQMVSFKETPSKPSFFYEKFIIGKLTDSVFIDDFITLNSFDEISKEILPFVKIRNLSNGPTIHVIANQGSIPPITDNPLVLVDGVPLTQIDKIIDWGSSKIKRVDVQNNQRFYGDLHLKNGIIMIWTKKMDFWSQYSINGTYNYSVMGFQKPIKIHFPDYSKNNDHSYPDFRQVLYWQPNLVLNSDKENQTSFYTSDEKGEFIIELFGVNSKGNIVKDFKSIIVK
jgi:hypothetical protein